MSADVLADVQSYARVRREVGAALRPVREALHRNLPVPAVAVFGYRFTGTRLFPLPARPGPAWYALYEGADAEGRTVSGTIEECAREIHQRELRAALAKVQP